MTKKDDTMTKYMAVLLMVGLFCGCDKTTSTKVKSDDNPDGKMVISQKIMAPSKVESPKTMAESKANMEKSKVIWQADPKNAAKRQAYDDAVADLMGKTAAATKGK
jgi:hypothetical protein